MLFTPDIQAGDYVMLSFTDGTYFSQIVGGAKTTSYVRNGNTIILSGTFGPNDITDNFESRLLNPGELVVLPCCHLCGISGIPPSFHFSTDILCCSVLQFGGSD